MLHNTYLTRGITLITVMQKKKREKRLCSWLRAHLEQKSARKMAGMKKYDIITDH